MQAGRYSGCLMHRHRIATDTTPLLWRTGTARCVSAFHAAASLESTTTFEANPKEAPNHMGLNLDYTFSVIGADAKTFDEMKAWLAAIPGQQDGTDDPHRTIDLCAFARFEDGPGQREFAEMCVVSDMIHQIKSFLLSGSGVLTWAVRPQFKEQPIRVGDRWDNNGPEYDTLTGRNYVPRPGNHRCIRAYAKLYTGIFS